MNAASSIISKCAVNPRADSESPETALILEPFLRTMDNFCFSDVPPLPPFNHVGRLSYANVTLSTINLDFSCVGAIQTTFLSLWNRINHKAYAAQIVVIPNCLDFTIDSLLCF